MKQTLEFWPLITITCLYFAFCNLHFYYSGFNINIFSFISSSDIILSFFPKMALGGLFVYSICVLLVMESPYTKLFWKIGEQQQEYIFTETRIDKAKIWLRKKQFFLYGTVLFVISAIYLILKKYLHFKNYELYGLSVAFDFLALTFLVINTSLNDRKLPQFLNRRLITALAIVLLIGQRISDYASLESERVKAGHSKAGKNHLCFKYADAVVKTGDSVLYIGETSNYLFLYAMKDSSTRAYAYSKIDSLIIK